MGAAAAVAKDAVAADCYQAKLQLLERYTDMELYESNRRRDFKDWLGGSLAIT
jgi:hypothetical protein